LDPIIKVLDLSVKEAVDPCSGAICKRHSVKKKTVHDLGTPDYPVDVVILYSRHKRLDGSTFAVDYSSVSPKGSRYTTRLIRYSMNLLKEGMTLRSVCDVLKKEHCVVTRESTLFEWTHRYEHLLENSSPVT
jgi:hypothetical protein